MVELQYGAGALHYNDVVRATSRPVDTFDKVVTTYPELYNQLLSTRAQLREALALCDTTRLRLASHIQMDHYRLVKQNLADFTRRMTESMLAMDEREIWMSAVLCQSAVFSRRWVAACAALFPPKSSSSSSASSSAAVGSAASSASSATSPAAAAADPLNVSFLSPAARARFWAHFSSISLDAAVPAAARPHTSMEDTDTLRSKWQHLHALSLAAMNNCMPPLTAVDDMLPVAALWGALHAMLPLPAPNAHLVLCSASTGDAVNVLTLFDVDCRMDCGSLEAYSAATLLELQWMRAGSSDALIAVGRTAAGLCAFEVRQKRAAELVCVFHARSSFVVLSILSP